MYKNLVFLLFIINISIYAQQSEHFNPWEKPLTPWEKEHYQIFGAKVKDIKEKYTFSDTSNLVKIFLDNVPVMIKNLKEKQIAVPDSVNENYIRLVSEPYLSWLEKNKEMAFDYNMQKLYNDLLTGNIINMKYDGIRNDEIGKMKFMSSELRDVMLDYNRDIERSVVLHDSLSAYIISSFLSLYKMYMLNVLYYRANYKVLRDNSNIIMGAVNNYFNMQKEFDLLEIWSNNEYKEKDMIPRLGEMPWADIWAPYHRYKEREEDSLYTALKILLANKQERAKLLKDTIFVKRYVGNQLYLLATLGDTQAEDKLIKAYQADKTFKGRRNILRQLVFVNTPKTINAVVTSFNDEIYDHPCSASIRVPIINELSRLYPDEKILRRLTETKFDADKKPTYPFFYTRSVWDCGKEPNWTAEYVQSVLNWIKKKFNITPNGGNKSLRLQKSDKGCECLIPSF